LDNNCGLFNLMEWVKWSNWW